MLQIIEHDNFREIVATEGYLHRRGTDAYTPVRRSTMLPTDTIDDFEELAELPRYTEADYKAKVQELIARRYSIADEIALLNNVKDGSELHVNEYADYMAYREQCKAEAKEYLMNSEPRV